MIEHLHNKYSTFHSEESTRTGQKFVIMPNTSRIKKKKKEKRKKTEYSLLQRPWQFTLKIPPFLSQNNTQARKTWTKGGREEGKKRKIRRTQRSIQRWFIGQTHRRFERMINARIPNTLGKWKTSGDDDELDWRGEARHLLTRDNACVKM